MSKKFETWVRELADEYNKTQEKTLKILNVECIKIFNELGERVLEFKERHNLGEEFYLKASKELIKTNGDDSKIVFEVGNIKDAVKFHTIFGDYLKNNSNMWDIIGTLPWHCHKLILIYVNDLNEALFYVQKAIDNNWDWQSIKKSIVSNDYLHDVN